MPSHVDSASKNLEDTKNNLKDGVKDAKNGHYGVKPLDDPRGATKDGIDYTNETIQNQLDSAGNLVNRAAKSGKKAVDSSSQQLKQMKHDISNTASQARDSAVETSSAIVKAFRAILDQIISPETRQKLMDNVQSFAVDAPLAFSFIVMQVAALSIPIAILAGYCTIVTTITIISALAAAATGIIPAILIALPIITAISAGTAAVWFGLVCVYLVVNRIYLGIYSGSRLQKESKYLASRLSKANEEIDHRAEEELNSYGRGIKNYGNEVADNLRG